VSRLEEIGEADAWRCWLCDEPVDPDMSVNDARGPSIDSVTTKAKARSKGGSVVGTERLAHRACNTKKGAVTPIVPWPKDLFAADPAPILSSVETLVRKRGRAVMARCTTAEDGEIAAAWLLDRVSRLAPDVALATDVEPGGGQFLVVLRTLDRAR
jgi:hypothetical protein